MAMVWGVQVSSYLSLPRLPHQLTDTYLDSTETRPLILVSSSPSLNASHISNDAPLLKDSSSAPLAVPVASNGVPRAFWLPLLQAKVAVRGTW
jgi:hypothetical protein